MVEPLVVRFVVGVTPSKWTRTWKDRMPRHPLDVLPATQAEALEGLASGEVDVAFVRAPVDKSVLHAIPLYTEIETVVAPRDHLIEAVDEITLAELEEFDRVPGADKIDDGWADSMLLVAANVGIATMPKSVARMLARKDVVARPIVDAPESQIVIAWSQENDSPAIQTFIGIVRGRTANSSR